VAKWKRQLFNSRIIFPHPCTCYIPSYYLAYREAIQYMSMVDPDLSIRLGFTYFSNPWGLKQGAKKTLFRLSFGQAVIHVY